VRGPANLEVVFGESLGGARVMKLFQIIRNCWLRKTQQSFGGFVVKGEGVALVLCRNSSFAIGEFVRLREEG
jgi:hypothetical protein